MQCFVCVNVKQMVASMGVVLNGANLYGYVRCKMGSSKKLPAAASNFLGQQVLGSVSIVRCSVVIHELCSCGILTI